MAMAGQGKKIVYELMAAFVVILLLIVFRPLFVGQVAQAGEPYTITYTNSTGDEASETVTPTATVSVSQTNMIYSVVIFIVALAALIVILLTVAGKI